MKTHFYALQIRVLIYREDSEWVARALEMDLLGYGDSPEAALGELRAALEAQISFAHQMDKDSLLMFPAEQDYVQRWDDAQDKALRREILGDKSLRVNAIAYVISFTKAELESLRKRRFKPSQPVCA